MNKITLPGDSLDFFMFMKKFDRLVATGQGNLNIVHFGGSHVQADMWTGQIRQNFNQFLNQKETSRGMIFPYKAVKTNGSLQFDIDYNKAWEGFRNVKLHYPENMGLMGWKATARDSGQNMQVTFKGDSYSSFYFDELRIFHDTGDQMFAFTIQIDSSVYTASYDSLCKCSQFFLNTPSNSFSLTVHKTDSLQNQFVLHGIQTNLNSSGLTYHSVGVNGASVSSYLNCLDFEHQLAKLKPDLLVFAIGINDAFSSDFSRQWFENNYNELIKRIKTTCPDVAILFMTNTDSYKTVRRRKYKNYTGNEVRVAMNNLAKKHGAAVWDLYSVMGGLGSISLWSRNGMAQRDHIHLNNAGYKYLGDLFFDAFLTKYESFVQNPLSDLTYE